MHQVPEVHPSRVPPPSYEEAMGQTPVGKENEYKPNVAQTYGHQNPAYLPSISGYQEQRTFVRCGTSRMFELPAEQPAPPQQCVVQCDRHKRQWKERYCGRKVAVVITIFILFIILAKVIIARAV